MKLRIIYDLACIKKARIGLKRRTLVCRARGFLPYAGMDTTIMNNCPESKYTLLAVMGVDALLKCDS